jgi:pilus assembly protein CpaC
MRFVPLFGPTGFAFALALAATSANAQPAPPNSAQPAPAPSARAAPANTDQPAAAAPAGGKRRAGPTGRGPADMVAATGRLIQVEVNKGILVRLPEPASTVFVADPEIADVQVKSPKLLYITAKSPGETVIYAVDAGDNVLLNAPIRVTLDLSRLRQSVAQLVPGAAVSADTVGSNLVLGGTVASAGEAEKVQSLAQGIAPKGTQLINRMHIATPNQVNLRVLIAEVDRNVLKQIGVDWTKLEGNSVLFQTFNSPPAPPVSNMLTALFGSHITATVQALATEGFLTVLAEPNLTAVSGQTASFLAGGEFPVPVAGSSGTAGFPTITVEFKKFGVQLAFTPTILDGNHLSLRVRPEVSQLSPNGAVSVPITSRAVITIPALTVRSAETTVELASGQSFGLAGLLLHTTQQDISKVPWIGDVPILGALFRSNKFQSNESELVILVTPYLVQPSSQPLSTPLAGMQFPHDVQQVLWSDTYRQKLPGPAQGPLGAGGQGLIGSAGFQLN